MDIKVAETPSLLIMRINSDLNDTVALVRDKCSAEELHWYRREVGKVMGALYLDIKTRLWTEHHSLKHHEMDGSYVVDPFNFAPSFYSDRGEE